MCVWGAGGTHLNVGRDGRCEGKYLNRGVKRDLKWSDQFRQIKH